MIKMDGKNVSDWIQKWEAKTGESLDLGYRVAVSFIYPERASIIRLKTLRYV